MKKIRIPFLLLLLLVGVAPQFELQHASAANIPAAPISVSLPAEGPNSFTSGLTFGPDGLLYAWTGDKLMRQSSLNDFSSYTNLGSVGNTNADAGPITFSRDGQRILMGAGAGGNTPGLGDNGRISRVPATFGTPGNLGSVTDVGNVPYHAAFLPAPIPSPVLPAENLYFVDAGTASFDSSSVVVFNETTGAKVTVIQNIPGASAGGLAMDSAGRLYVGVGFGAAAGQFRTFSMTTLTNAFNANAAVNWSTGTLFNASTGGNSAASVFIDNRGYLFAGGGDGLTVFDPAGNAKLFSNGGYTTATYDPVHDRVLITGFGTQQGVYPAAIFVPEPGSIALALTALAALTYVARRQRIRMRSAPAHFQG